MRRARGWFWGKGKVIRSELGLVNVRNVAGSLVAAGTSDECALRAQQSVIPEFRGSEISGIQSHGRQRRGPGSRLARFALGRDDTTHAQFRKAGAGRGGINPMDCEGNPRERG